MGFDALPADVRGAVVALAVTLAALAAARLLRMPRLSAVAMALGVAAGCLAVTGVIAATPRQLAERVPMLAMLGLVAALAVAALRRPWLRVAAGVAGVIVGAWWMSGAPLHPDTLLRAAPVAAALAVAMGVAALRGSGPTTTIAAVALAAGLVLAAARGPHLAYALAVFGAVLGAAAAGQAGGAPARVASGIMLVGVAAVPVLGRGAPADWAAAAALALALLAGAWVGARLPRRIGPWAGPALAAAPAIAAVVLLR